MEKETQVKVVKKDNSLGSIRIADEVVSSLCILTVLHPQRCIRYIILKRHHPDKDCKIAQRQVVVQCHHIAAPVCCDSISITEMEPLIPTLGGKCFFLGIISNIDPYQIMVCHKISQCSHRIIQCGSPP